MQQDANKVPQQIMHPQYSMYYSLIPIKVWFQTWLKFHSNRGSQKRKNLLYAITVYYLHPLKLACYEHLAT